MKKMNNHKEVFKRLKVFTALFVISALLIQFFGNNYLLAFTQDNVIATYEIGVDKDNVTATLTTDGKLKLAGTGEIKNYTAETMPFANNVDKITDIEIEEGITSIGDYLFFGCKNLNNKLELPSTITYIGDYAFNGYSKETAPAFTYITNDFKSADIIVPVEKTNSEIDAEKPDEDAAPTSQNESTEAHDGKAEVKENNESSEPAEAASDTKDKENSTENVGEPATPQTDGQPEMKVKTITEQEIGTDIFCAGQTGGYKSNETNKSFNMAVEKAGYIEADRFITVSLDGVITQTLPVKDGKMLVPNLPKLGISSPVSDDAFTTHTFSGWSYENATYQPADQLPISDTIDKLTLTSNWNAEWKINPQVKTEAKEEVSVYYVIDANTGKALEKVNGYVLSVQWQINKADEKDESAWKDIKDATELTYKRKVVSGDTSSHFRAKISILKQAKARSINDPKVMTTDAVAGINSLAPITIIYDANGGTGTMASQTFSENAKFKPNQSEYTAPDGKVFTGWKVTEINGVIGTYPSGTKTLQINDIIKPETIEYTLTLGSGSPAGNIKLTAEWDTYTIIYVDQSNGIDTNSGSKDAPVKTLDKAFSLLPSDGSIENNIIEVISDTLSTNQYLGNNGNRKKATICGQESAKTKITIPHNVYLLADVKIEKVSIGNSDSFYFEQYAHHLFIGKDTVAMAKHNYGYDSGVPEGTCNNDIYPTFNERMDATAKSAYGTAGKNKDDPIITQVDAESYELGRFGALGRNTDDANHQTSSNNYVHTIVNLNGGSLGLYCSGGVSDKDEYGNATLNIDGGYIYNVNISNNSYRSLSTFTGDTNINIYSGRVSTLNCGPLGRYATNITKTVGTTKLNIYGGTIENLYMGGSTGIYVGDITTNMYGGTVNNFYGGGYGYSPYIFNGKYYTDAAKVTGDISIYISGGIITGDVYGGGKGYNLSKTSGVIDGNVSLTIDKDATVNGSVYVGGKGLTSDSSSAKITKNSTLNINGGTIKGNVYGGGDLGQIEGESTITVTGGVINGNIYGGGNNVGVSTSNITIIGTPTITGNIYGGSNASGTTTASNVNIKGTVTNNVYAGGKGKNTTVTNANLNVETDADIKGNAFGGSEEGVVTNSVVNLNGGKANNIFGGSDKASITGSVKINSLAGSNVTSIYAGCNASGSVKNPILNLAGKATNVFGGGNATPNTSEDIDGTSTINVKTNEANKITNVYGGANNTGKVTSPHVNISGYVENTYGGGLGKDTITNTPLVNIKSGGNVTGSVFGGGEEGDVAGTTVTLENGSTVKNAYAGGNKAGVTDTVKLVTLAGSKATSIYGGSNSSGTVTKPILEIAGDAENVFGGGFEGSTNSGINGTIVDAPAITVTGGTITNVYGGGEKGPTVNTNTITITGGKITNIFGGGKSASSVNTSIILKNNTNTLLSSVDNIYGGSESTGVTENSNIEVDGNVKKVFGGGKGQSTSVKKTYIKTQASSKAENIYGGSEEGKVTNATVVVMGPVEQSIYGGGLGSTSVVTGDTWVYVANDVKDSIYGGGNQGGVEGNTHVDIAKGTIGSSSTTGNVFGGSNQAKVKGNTKVHIGSFVVDAPTGAALPAGTDKNIQIKGTVFGGGNTTSTGKDFDASDPYVLGKAVVEIGGTAYTLDISKSIFGDGNKCVTNGDKEITIKDYKALKENANTSIQRATILTIENSDIELIGEKDTANLVTTINYSLNRIDKLVLKGGSLLKLQSPVNLVMGLESRNADDSLQSSSDANHDSTGNRLYIQQGQHVDFRINEDVSRPGYGDVKGFAQLGRYYIDDKSIDSAAQGVYVMGSYYADPSSNTESGFIVAENEAFAGQTALNKGDIITATTNSSSWRNWLLGSSVKNAMKNMVVSDEPGDGKTAMVTETWAADGSIYRIDPASVKISGNGKYTIVNPNDITLASPENTIGLSIETGQTGWLEQSKAGYIDSATKKIIPYKAGTTDTAAVDDSLDMRSIINDSQSPVINVKLYNSDNITTTDTTPLVVSFTVDRISEQADGSEVKTGSIVVTMNITQKATESFTNVLVSQGKTYDRGEQSYNYDTASGEATSVSRNSSVTAQYAEKSKTAKTVTGYKLNIKSGDGLNDSTLPLGTKVLMIDKSSDIPVYYVYTVTNAAANISLTDFMKSGTLEKYKLPTAPIKKSNFIFVFDFMNTANDKDLLVTLVSDYSSGASSEKKLRFKATGSDRTYNIASEQDNSSASSIPSYRMNGMFGITLKTTANADANAGTDTTGSDLQMAAKVQLKLTNTATGTVLPIPKGWQIQSNGTRYSTSGDSATIILANSLTATNSDIYVIMSNMGDIPAGSYKLEISLVSGAMANYPSSMLDTKTIVYRFNLTDDRYSIKATIKDDAKQVIAQTDPDKTLSYDIIRFSNNSTITSNIETKVTLWKKDGGAYVEANFDDVVDKVNDITTGREVPITNQIVPWATYKTISFKLKDTAAAGTYQLRYEIVEKNKTNNILASEVSSFILTTD